MEARGGEEFPTTIKVRCGRGQSDRGESVDKWLILDRS